MKREDLRAIEGLTEEQINEIMRLHGQDAATYQATVQGLQAQLATAQQGLAAFDGVDVNDLRSQITNLTNQLNTQAAEYAFNNVLRSAAREAGALDEADVIQLLPDRATLRESKNQAEDVKQAFADLKSRKPYLFQQGSPAPQDGGSEPQPGNEPQATRSSSEAPQPGWQCTAHPAGVSPDDRCRAHGPAHPQPGAFPAALHTGEGCTTLTR